MRLVDVQGVHQCLDGPGVDYKTRLGGDQWVGLAKAWAVHQDHPVAGIYKRVDVTVKVSPPRGASTGTMDHDYGWAFTGLVVMHFPLRGLYEFAGVFLGESTHGS
ncbi:hypothetical protein D3C72_1768200 [compost metagenome]